MDIDIVADLNAEDDDGLGWSTLGDAREPDRVRPGVMLLAGNRYGRAVVRVVEVDVDGQVHFASELLGSRLRRESVDAADVLLRPPVDRYGLLDFDKVRPLVDAAYEWAISELAREGVVDRVLGD